MGRYEKIAFVVISVLAYVYFLAALSRLFVLTVLLVFSYFVYHIAIATEVRIIEGIIEIGFAFLLLSIRRPVAELIGKRLEAAEDAVADGSINHPV
jgi:hypothetical protein